MTSLNFSMANNSDCANIQDTVKSYFSLTFTIIIYIYRYIYIYIYRYIYIYIFF